MTYQEIEALPISIDTALEVLGMLQAQKTGEEFQKLEQEKNILLGLTGTAQERKEMFIKVSEIYTKNV